MQIAERSVVGFPRLKDPLSASLSSIFVRVAIRFHVTFRIIRCVRSGHIFRDVILEPKLLHL